MASKEIVKDSEGDVEFFRYPHGESRKGPAKKGGVFYNPAMEDNRTIAVMVLSLMYDRLSRGKRTVRILDAMGATGVRGLRMAVEGLSGRTGTVVINDINPDAVALMERNRDHIMDSYDMGDVVVEVSNEEVNALLSSSDGYDFIDIDPFGTPAPYIQSAVRALRFGGVVAFTATDTAALFGTYPRVCRRRYLTEVHRSPINYEAGLRALMGSIIRLAGTIEIALQPLLAYYEGHYLRVYFTRGRSIKDIDRMLDSMGYYIYNRSEGAVKLLDSTRPEALSSYIGDGTGRYVLDGPLWNGNLGQADFCRKLSLMARDAGHTGVVGFLDLLTKDMEAQPYYYRTDDISRVLKRKAPKIDVLIENLRDIGYSAHRTHFHPMAVKTNAPLDTIKSMFI